MKIINKSAEKHALYLQNLDSGLLYLLNTTLTLNNSIQIEQHNNESK